LQSGTYSCVSNHRCPIWYGAFYSRDLRFGAPARKVGLDRAHPTAAVPVAPVGTLSSIGLTPSILATFPPEFIDGMATLYRSRILGDVGSSAPENWDWGGPANDRVDIVLLLYARDESALASAESSYTASLQDRGLAQVTTLDTVDLGDREHFGFHDGISQPVIVGGPKPGLPADTVKAGEFILGYANEYGLYTDRPMAPASVDPQGQLPLGSWDDLTPNQQWQADLRRVYGDDVEQLDLTVGMFAETPRPGFGFSDTAVRIFLLMASRRLNSDRFFTTDFNERVYTRAGMEWLRDSTMSTVLLRHYPALAPA
jgi:hypothetical protein